MRRIGTTRLGMSNTPAASSMESAFRISHPHPFHATNADGPPCYVPASPCLHGTAVDAPTFTPKTLPSSLHRCHSLLLNLCICTLLHSMLVPISPLLSVSKHFPLPSLTPVPGDSTDSCWWIMYNARKRM